MPTKKPMCVNVESTIIAQIDAIAAAMGVYNRSMMVEFAMAHFLKYVGTLTPAQLSALVHYQATPEERPKPLVRRRSGQYMLVESKEPKKASR